ncbi:hypothetical protein FO519_001207 [Halicephalobus sp. NKZ332]|nr:hypothetical protein FO519_001207 [Halicephalobus sp. NKZ332]
MTIIFDDIVRIRLHNCGTFANSNDNQKLRLRIEKSSSGDTDDFLIELSDDVKIDYLFRLHLSRTEYERIRLEQGLGVEFDQLPARIVDFIRNLDRNTEDWFEGTVDSDGSCKFELMTRRSDFRTNSLLTLLIPRVLGQELVEHLVECAQYFRKRFTDDKSTLGSMKRRLETLEDEVDKLTSENSKLKDELRHLESDKKRLTEEVNSIEHDYNILKEEAHVNAERIKELTNDVEALRDDADELEEMLDESNAKDIRITTRTLMTEIAEKGKKREQEVIQLRKEVQELRRHRGQLEDDVEEFKAVLADTRTENQLLREDLQRRQDVTDILQKEIDGLKIQMEIKNKVLVNQNRVLKPTEAQGVRSLSNSSNTVTGKQPSIPLLNVKKPITTNKNLGR